MENLDRVEIGLQQGLIYDPADLNAAAEPQKPVTRKEIEETHEYIDTHYKLYEIFLHGFAVFMVVAIILWNIYFFSVDSFEAIVLSVLGLNEIRRITYKGLKAKKEHNMSQQFWMCWNYIGYITLAPILSVVGVILWPQYSTLMLSVLGGILVYFSFLLVWGYQIRRNLESIHTE